MSRPCNCNKVVPGDKFVLGRDCRLCWLYHHDLAYREMWDGHAVEEGPGLLEKAGNLTAALTDWAKAGFAVVDEETYQKRIQTCLACPHFVNNVCKLCGCAVAGERVKKARLASSKCPDKPPRW